MLIRVFLLVVIPLSCLLVWRISTNFYTYVVFCNVGQGDAAFVHIPPATDIIIDGGPVQIIPDCVETYKHPLDKTIELVILTHADSDHYSGLIPLITRYKVMHAILPKLENKSASYQLFLTKMATLRIPVYYLSVGDSVEINNVRLVFHWPPPDLTQCSRERNSCSYIFTLSYRGLDVAFTGDADTSSLRTAFSQSQPLPSYEIIKVPHHGSRDALSKDVLAKVNPLMGVISVGKNNQYQHPDDSVIGMLRLYQYRRTDTDGNVIVQVPLRLYQRH